MDRICDSGSYDNGSIPFGTTQGKGVRQFLSGTLAFLGAPLFVGTIEKKSEKKTIFVETI